MRLILFVVLALLLVPTQADAQSFTEPKTISAPEVGRFGTAVSADGDIVVVGAPFEDNRRGAVYVFDCANSPCTRTATLRPSDGSINQWFGRDIDLEQGVIVIGTRGGSAYVFQEPPDGWQDMAETVKLTASDSATGDCFGCAVVVDRNAVLVGAPGKNNNTGAAYLFEPTSNDWGSASEQAIFTASDGNIGAQFGKSVDKHGNTIAIGAPEQNGSGSAYVFINTSTWQSATETAILTASDARTNDRLGHDVLIRTAAVIVGAPGKDVEAGQVYAFLQPPSGWQNTTESFTIQPTDSVPHNQFGWSIAGQGSVITIGSLGYGNGQSDGGVYSFTCNFAGCTQREQLVTSNSGTGALYGYSVGLSASQFVVGTPGNHNAQVFAFDGGTSTLPADVNADGVITPTDVIYVLNRLNTTERGADIDQDGLVTIEDVNLVIDALGQSVDE